MRKFALLAILCMLFTTSNAQIEVGYARNMGFSARAKNDDIANFIEKGHTIYVCRTENENEKQVITEIMQTVWKATSFDVIFPSELDSYITKKNHMFITHDLYGELWASSVSFLPVLHFWGIRKNGNEVEKYTYANIVLELSTKSSEKLESFADGKASPEKKLEKANEWYVPNAKFTQYSNGILKLYLSSVSYLLQNNEEKHVYRGYYKNWRSPEIGNLLKDTLFISKSLSVSKRRGHDDTNRDEFEEEIEDFPYPVKIVSEKELSNIILNSEKTHYVLLSNRYKKFEVYNSLTGHIIFSMRPKFPPCNFTISHLKKIYKIAKKES